MYLFFPQLLDRADLLDIREEMLAKHQQYVPDIGPYGRNGFSLGYSLEQPSWLFAEVLESLLEVADDNLDGRFKFRPEWSSCQYVKPDSALGFPPHQDVAALDVHSESDKAGVFWIPLDDITPRMATLKVYERNFGILPHVGDAGGRSIIDPAVWATIQSECTEFEVMDYLRIGDVILMDPFCIHATHVPTVCDQPRLSLDIRVKPLA